MWFASEWCIRKTTKHREICFLSFILYLIFNHFYRIHIELETYHRFVNVSKVDGVVWCSVAVNNATNTRTPTLNLFKYSRSTHNYTSNQIFFSSSSFSWYWQIIAIEMGICIERWKETREKIDVLNVINWNCYKFC